MELLQEKAHLIEQDVVLVPCNQLASKHWFLIVVLFKERKVLDFDNMAATFPNQQGIWQKRVDEKQWSIFEIKFFLV